MENSIQGHEYELGGILECDTLPDDLDFADKHVKLAGRIEEMEGKFRMLKSEIFNYAGGILKRRKH